MIRGSVRGVRSSPHLIPRPALTIDTGSGVFSRGHLDHATAVLFKELEPPVQGQFLDLGCGYGVIGLAMAKAVPLANVTAVDVNERSLRLTRDNINGQQFVNLLRLLRASHPETEKFILYLDNAKYYHAAVVQEWLARHPEFHLEPVPAYSPNLNVIERLWKVLRAEATHNRLFAHVHALAGALDRTIRRLARRRRPLLSLILSTRERAKSSAA